MGKITRSRMGKVSGICLAIAILIILVLVFWLWGDDEVYPDEMTEAFRGRGGGWRGGMSRGGGWRGGVGGRGRGSWRGQGGGGPRSRPWRGGSWLPWGYGDVNLNYYAEPTAVIESATQEARDSSGNITTTNVWADGMWSRSRNGELQDSGQIPFARAGSILRSADLVEASSVSYKNDGISYSVMIRYSTGGASTKDVGASVIPSDLSEE